MDRVDSYYMGRGTRGRDLGIGMEVDGGDANFLVVVEGLDISMVIRDKEVSKKNHK